MRCLPSGRRDALRQHWMRSGEVIADVFFSPELSGATVVGVYRAKAGRSFYVCQVVGVRAFVLVRSL